jgi:hypothetical protein
LRRVVEVALEYDVALRLTGDGAIEVLGRLSGQTAPRIKLRQVPPRRSPPGPLLVETANALSMAPPPPQQPSLPAAHTHPRAEVDQSFVLQRALRKNELIAMKSAAYEIGVSQVTLWRACQCDLPDFPPPIVIRRRIYWWKKDLNALEDSIMYYQGRGDYERRRDAKLTS